MKLALILVTLATTASAEPLVIAAGKPSGQYDQAAQTLSQRLQQRNVDAAVLNFAGSDEITLAICSHKADAGITQIDAIYARAKEGCQLKPVASYGHEDAMIFFPPDSPYDELSDLTASNHLLVDTIGSGSELFARTIIKLEQSEDASNDEWAQVQLVNDDPTMATTLAEFGDIDAVLLVRKPNSPVVNNLLALGWTLGELWDKNIDDLIFNRKPLYTPAKVEIITPGLETWNYTYEVNSFYVVSPDMPQDLYRAIQATFQ